MPERRDDAGSCFIISATSLLVACQAGTRPKISEQTHRRADREGGDEPVDRDASRGGAASRARGAAVRRRPTARRCRPSAGAEDAEQQAFGGELRDQTSARRADRRPHGELAAFGRTRARAAGSSGSRTRRAARTRRRRSARASAGLTSLPTSRSSVDSDRRTRAGAIARGMRRDHARGQRVDRRLRGSERHAAAKARDHGLAARRALVVAGPARKPDVDAGGEIGTFGPRCES